MQSQALPKPLTFEEFLAWYPENGRYELIDGIAVEMLPTGQHEQVSGFIATELGIAIQQQQFPYFIPRLYIVKPFEGQSGYTPDIIVLDKQTIGSEPLWRKQSVITRGTSIKLAVEVVSTNWRDDYLKKLADYEAMGISEYWIADYLGIGGMRYIGSPKQPAVSVYQLIGGEYQVTQFKGTSRIESPTFPTLTLTVEDLVRVGQEIEA